MPRSTNAPASRARRKKVLKQAKGFYQGRRKFFQNANETVKRGMAYAFRDRKVKKREFRKLWIARINAATRDAGMPYSQFIAGMRLAGIELDRKILSELAITDAAAFTGYVEIAKAALAKQPAAVAPAAA